MAGTHTDRRLVLLGRTGSGKSATGNTILRRNRLNERIFREDVFTSVCRRKQAAVNQRAVIVVDTPGLFNPAKDEEDLITEIKRGVRMSAPGPHAFLLVIRLDMDLTEEEKNIMTWIQGNLGEDAVNYIFILFTHDDHLNGESLEDYMRQNPDLQLLVEQFDGRYHSFNNRNRQNRRQVTELMEKIEQMVQINRGQFYRPQEVGEMESGEMESGEMEPGEMEPGDVFQAMFGIALGIGLSIAAVVLKLH